MRSSSSTSQDLAGAQVPHGRRGVISLILGCMFSGKTTELLRRMATMAPSQVLAVKPAIDTRYAADAIVSHAGKAVPAIAVSVASEIVFRVGPETRLVAVDEAHFLDSSLVDVIVRLRDQGLDVVIASLEPDSWARPFPINALLREITDECVLRTANCARCGASADRTQRLTPIVAGRMVVDPSNYEPRCERCWRPPVEAGK